MNRWVARKNIDDFRQKSIEERDPDKQRVLRELLAKEEHKLRMSGADTE